ncbi:MAG TPA: TSUP family transporter, partial [Allosphingosinicella sp.]
WGRPHAIAGTSAVFILVNSLAGLAGQLSKSGGAVADTLQAYWPLFPAVLLGGLIGSALGARRFNPPALRVLTALLILFVAAQLARRFVAMA